MTEVVLSLVSSRPETPSVRSFMFTSEPPAKWDAGQYLMLRMEAPGDPRGPSRMFTISASPTEPRVMITTHVVNRSPFKEKLAGLPFGTPLKARVPMGTFGLHDDATKRAVFLAGGIGITPFRSMIRRATDAGLPQDILLLYSARTPEEIVFRRDLEILEDDNPLFKMVTTITRMEDSTEHWDGLTGHIDAAFVRKHAGPLDDAIVYAAGPPASVQGLVDLVAGLGVPKERIRAERFTGY